MRKTAIMIAILGACLAGSVSAQADRTQIIDQLIGVWVSDGDAFGDPAKTTMRWGQTLGGKFIRLDYRIEMQSQTGEASAFEGVAYYRPAGANQYTAYWADTRGELHPIKAERRGNALIADWGSEGAKQGRTRYQILQNGMVEVTDWIKTDEGWRQFNQNQFKPTSSREN